MQIKLFVIPFLFFLISTNTFTQKSKVKNLPDLDKTPYHYGFQLGVTYSSFYIDREANFSFDDSLLAITLETNPSMSFNFLFSLDFNKNIHFRTGINVFFQDRNI